MHGKPHVGLALLSDEAAKISQLTLDDLIGEEKRNGTTAQR
jgi:hypothetical protein